jgi:16S rRNA processing protein RimM
LAPEWDEMALVGRVARAHGLKGQVVVNVETDFPEGRFRSGAELFVNRGGRVAGMQITSVRFHRERPVIALQGVDDVEAAEALAGLELRVPAAWLTPLPPGTFYRHDLVGCAVETGDGRPIGTVVEVEGSMTGSRLVLRTGRGEVLVPLADSICTTIDPDRKRIVIDPPEGLLDLNQPGSR